MIYSKEDGRYPRWFTLLNEAFTVVVVVLTVLLLVLGIEYALCVGNW